MHRLPLLLLLTLGTTAVLADPPPPAPPAEAKEALATPPAPADKPWSVVGTWDCTQPDWSGPVELRADGSLVQNGMPSADRWLLTVQEGRVLLVLQWSGWPAQALPMVSADEFAGKVHNGEMRLRRRQSAPLAGPFGSVETRAWHQGEPPVKLIRQDEGFCALSLVTGHFQGSAEIVRVYVGEDGYWYLGGSSQQENVAAECIVVRYRKPLRPHSFVLP